MARPRALVEAELLEQAATLFASRGFAATSLQDVADAIGISRSALYHYIESKEQLLVKIVAGVTFDVARDLREIADTSAAPAARLDQAISRLVELMTEHSNSFRLLEQTHTQLPPDLTQRHRVARVAALNSITDIIRDGMSSGEFRRADARVVAFSVLGMTNWIAWWIHSAPEPPPQTIAHTMSSLVLRGLLDTTNGTDAPTGEDRVARTVASIRCGLAELEEMLQNAPDRDAERPVPQVRPSSSAEPWLITPEVTSATSAPST